MEIITKEQLAELRAAGFVVIHREPTEAMAKAFYANYWPEEIDFAEAYHRMIAQSIREQNATPPNNTLHPNHSETAQERPAPPASGAIMKDAS